MEKWFKTLSIKELSTWIKNFDNSTWRQKVGLNQFLDNQPTSEDIKTAKRILKNKKAYFKQQLMKDTHISF
tara:strand:+ start:299 stop:511 length:213 start_codon:yes stop_codon:yes gene_type:complete